jgi:ribulose-5-phosphate 4-epimerase/fuculose-1-phosphate aldolase
VSVQWHLCSRHLLATKDPVEPHTLWVNPFGISFQQMRKSDLVRIDHEGKVLEGGNARLINRAAVMIHAAGWSLFEEDFEQDADVPS